MTKKYIFTTCFILLICFPLLAQEEFSLYQQFNGRYDFTFVGNTMNVGENNYQTTCTILNTSSDILDLQDNDQIESAYLYWSGSGSGENHLQIKLNDIDVVAEQHFVISQPQNRRYFVAYADVSEQVQNTGNGTYTVSDFDLSSIISPLYCSNATNYAGWGIVVVYKNETLPHNQINIFHGFDHISGNGVTVGEINVTLDNLNVTNTTGAKIGFIAWEGDTMWATLESLMLNGEKLSNPPLNPEDNAFNSTNSVTGSSQLYNMDLDIYDAENYIQVGDTTAEVKLTSGRDFVMLSTIVTKLNNNRPDATIQINEITPFCLSSEIQIDYTVFNYDSTDFLPANTPISVYINNEFFHLTHTQNDIPIDGSEDGSITISIENTTEIFEVYLVVDDVGDSSGIVTEIIETNNTSNSVWAELPPVPEFNIPENLIVCNLGKTTGIFDFSEYEYLIKQNPDDVVTFHNSYEDSQNGLNPVFNTSSYQTNEIPKEIFVRIENEDCYSIISFFLHLRNCPPIVFNAISANDDMLNDDFHIEGLYDIFEDFELYVYSRWGQLLWKGNNNIPKWDGKVTEKGTVGHKNVPEGTYFYILYLNDKDYPNPITGYLYLTR